MSKFDQKNVVFLLGEGLGAKTLKPTLDDLLVDPRIKVTVLNDGFVPHVLESLDIDYIPVSQPFDEEVIPYLEHADLIISGKSYAQNAENDLMRLSKKRDIPYVIFIADIGGEIGSAKFNERDENGKLLLPDKIMVADQATHHSMVRSGIPASLFIPVGHPYFDSLAQRMTTPVSRSTTLLYTDTCFELDYERGILPAGPYQHQDYINDIIASAKQVGRLKDLRVKLHPQSDRKHFQVAEEQGVEIIEGDTFDAIRESDVVMSSYSTTLLESALAGVPAISYQPWRVNIRSDVFLGRVSMVDSRAELVQKINQVSGSENKPDTSITYNLGNARQTALGEVYKLLGLPSQISLQRRA